jgi:hypothetical protein
MSYYWYIGLWGGATTMGQNLPTIQMRFPASKEVSILVAKAELNICASFAKIKFRLTGVDNGDKVTAVLIAEVDDTADFACDVEQNYWVLRDHIEHTIQKYIKIKETKSTNAYFRNSLKSLRDYLRINHIELTYFNGDTFVVLELIRARPKHSIGPIQYHAEVIPRTINFKNGTIDLCIIEAEYTPLTKKTITAKFPDEIRDIIEEHTLKNRSDFSINSTLSTLDNGNKNEEYVCIKNPLIGVFDAIITAIKDCH